MGAIKNFANEVWYQISTKFLGEKTREQIAEEERKAAMEIERAEMEASRIKAAIEQERINAEKRQREAVEKARKDFLADIEQKIKASTVVVSDYEVLSSGATEQEIVDGRKLRKQSFKLEISIGNSYSASVIITNDPDHINYRGGVELSSFLNWRGMSETITHTFPGNQGLVLGEEEKRYLNNAIKKCSALWDNIVKFDKSNVPPSLWSYCDTCFTTFKNEASLLLTTKIVSSSGKHDIVCNGAVFPFDISTYEFKRSDLTQALGVDKITEDQMFAFRKSIYLAAASTPGNTGINLTNVDLDNLKNSYIAQTGIDLKISQNKYNHYTLSYRLPGNDEVYYLENCENVGFGEAYGAISRAIAQHNQQPQVKTMIDLDNELKNLCSATNQNMRRQSWRMGYKVTPTAQPGIYSFEVSAKATIMGKKCTASWEPSKADGVDNLIINETSNPARPMHIASVLDKFIDEFYEEYSPTPKIKHRLY